jgi:magnesium-transporting ATPase (P-type)
MVSIGKSFEFIKKPLETEPAIIKTFTTTYLLVFNEVLLIYIYFIFLCFILKDNSMLGGLVKFLFVAVTIGVSFIVLGYASDALKKIKELSNAGNYSNYTDLLNKLVMVSVVLIVLSFFWIFLRFRASRIERQKRQSLKALHQVATTGVNVRSTTQQKKQQQKK